MPLTAEDVRSIVTRALAAGHFFVPEGTTWETEHVAAETRPWEVFRGRLLAPNFTREKRTFESWNIYLRAGAGRTPEPVLSVKLDVAAGELFVVRALEAYVHEPYDAGGNVIQTREVARWVRELVGRLELDRDSLEEELTDLLFRAVVGTSRLPLTSVEAPLPAFSFGQLGYFPHAADTDKPATTPGALFANLWTEPQPWPARVKLLELALRAASLDEIERLAFLIGQIGERLPVLLRDLFNDVSLSPYHDFVTKALRFAGALEKAGHLSPADVVDFLGYLLRQSGRHLTAFDLVVFHNRGANYPDALMLDEVLRAYREWIEGQPELFQGPEARLRRRALRQAWLVRCRYEGQSVPDAPTSPGDQTRVLPTPRVPEEQILRPETRTRKLFSDPLPLDGRTAEVLNASLADLDDARELRELGTALFLDRPLGAFKAPGEPDATILLSAVAFSRSITGQRLDLLRDRGLLSRERHDELHRRLAELPVNGVSVFTIPASPRPGVASLADARQASRDFVFLHTTERTIQDFCDLYGRNLFAGLEGQRLLLVGSVRIAPQPELVLTIHDAAGRPRRELTADPRAGFVLRRGVEHPRSGLKVTRAWNEDGCEVPPNRWGASSASADAPV